MPSTTMERIQISVLQLNKPCIGCLEPIKTSATELINPYLEILVTPFYFFFAAFGSIAVHELLKACFAFDATVGRRRRMKEDLEKRLF